MSDVLFVLFTVLTVLSGVKIGNVFSRIEQLESEVTQLKAQKK